MIGIDNFFTGITKVFYVTIYFFEFFSQFRALAINLAVVVFPTPLIPVNKYAFGVFPILIAFVIVFDNIS